MKRRAAVAWALLAAAPLAAAQDFQDAQALQFTGNAEFRAQFVDGVKSWTYALENARRAMLVQRCTALEPRFPQVASPRMVAAANAANVWLTGSPVPGVTPFEQRLATREASAMLVRATFADADLRAWDGFRNSAAGRRALAVSAMAQSLDAVGEYLTELGSGTSWDWPLARLRKLSDGLGLRSAFDAAMNEAEAGAAQRVARMDDVPGPTANASLIERIAQASEAGDLSRAFLESIAASDRAAFEQLQGNPQYVRWNKVFEPFGEFLSGGLPEPVRGRQAPMTAADFCARAELSGCEAGSPLRTRLEQVRIRWAASIMSDQVVTTIQQIVRRTPEAGCPN